jgi:hypothetical protein
LLKSNFLKLPNLFEVDNEETDLKEVLKLFMAMSGYNSLVVKNYKNKVELQNYCNNFQLLSVVFLETKKVAFFSKNIRGLPATIWCPSTDVKRVLTLNKQVVEIDNMLLVTKLSSGRNRKGISEKQFDNEFFNKNYDYFAITSNNNLGISLCFPHLSKKGFKRVCGFRIPSINNGLAHYHYPDYLHLFAKE